MKFQPGRSANPKGRPRGIVDRRTKLRVALEKDGQRLLAVMVEKAMAGDTESLRFLLSRILPPARDVPVSVKASGSLAQRGESILAAMMGGSLTASDGNELLAGLVAQTRIEEISELRSRLERLEQAYESIHTSQT